MKQSPIVIKTSDGSHTLFLPQIEEHYHSIHGAIQESAHVFITAGLDHLHNKNNIHIFEVGFGTGLNALLTSEYAEKNNLKIHYHTVELYPIDPKIVEQLNYKQYNHNFEQIHNSDWEKEIQINKHFSIHKTKADFSTNSAQILTSNYNLIYYDAFSPDKQPQMWTQQIFDNLYQHTTPGGILTTYCAKGNIRRMLIQSGYTVERIAGPPGKREMIRATKQ